MSSSFFQTLKPFFRTFKLSLKKKVLPPQKRHQIKTVNVMQLHGCREYIEKFHNETRRSLIGLSDWSYDFKTGYTTWVGDKRRKTILDPMCILY